MCIKGILRLSRKGWLIVGIVCAIWSATHTSASECSRQCHHGGRPNSDCSACVNCDNGYDPAQDCSTCLPCNGNADAASCSCICLEGWSGSPTCDVNVCAAVSVYAQTIHVFASDYTSNKNHEQFVIHDGATFTGFSGQKQMGSSSSHYIFNDFIVLSGGAINCSGYAVSTDLNAPANDGKRRLGLHGTIWVAAGGILDLESCIEGDPTSVWAKWTLVRYEVGAIIHLGKLEDSMMLHYASGIQSRVQCPLDAGMEISNLNPSQCSRQCHHGGRPNSDCSACVDCDNGFDPAQDCSTCLPCNGNADAASCSCI